MKPIYVTGSKFLKDGWYIYSIEFQDVIEGEGCGPFSNKDGAIDAIGRIKYGT